MRSNDLHNHEHVVRQSGLCMRLQLPETPSSAVLASGARLALGTTSNELAASSAASSLITPLLLVCRDGTEMENACCLLLSKERTTGTGHLCACHATHAHYGYIIDKVCMPEHGRDRQSRLFHRQQHSRAQTWHRVVRSIIEDEGGSTHLNRRGWHLR